MSKFVPRWSQWSVAEEALGRNADPEMAKQRTCKTCKSPFEGFAGGQGGHSGEFTTGSELDSAPSVRSSVDLDHAQVESMDLATFAEAGLIVFVRSGVLDREVIFVSDDVPDAALAGNSRPAFRASELRKLAILRPAPSTLQVIHEVKAIFNGVIVDVRE